GDSARSEARAAAAAPGRELAVTGATRRQLRAAAVDYHRSGRVNGPLLDSVRLARYGGAGRAPPPLPPPPPPPAPPPPVLPLPRRRRGRAGADLGRAGPSLGGAPKPVPAAWRLTRRARGCTAPLRGGAPPPVGD